MNLLIKKTSTLNATMSSLSPTRSEIDLTGSETPLVDSQTSQPNIFGRMMIGINRPSASTVKDQCDRPVPIYNLNYNPEKDPRDDLPKDYSPYTYGEPLYDARPIVLSRLPQNHVPAGASKRDRTSWVWYLGYALSNKVGAKTQIIWACKHCKLFVKII